MTGRKGYGRGDQGQWWMQDVAQTAVPQVRRLARLPSRIVEDGWWLVAGLAGDVEEPRRVPKRPAGTKNPVLVLQGRTSRIFQRRST